MPPTPIAASRLMAPVEIDSTRTRASAEPIFMMAPLPQFFSICAIARFSAFFLSSLTVDTAISFHLSLDVGPGVSQRKSGEIATRREYEASHDISRLSQRKTPSIHCALLCSSQLAHKDLLATRNAFSTC